MAPTVAALFVRYGGLYYGLDDVEPWGLPNRDAREYAGPWPVVAHPPCARWCQLAKANQSRYGLAVGDDDGCFASALASVREFGGVLEHPALSLAWDTFGLVTPAGDGWIQEQVGRRTSWVCEVSQAAYGHRARKMTWLYYVGKYPPPPLKWSRPKPTAWISTDRPRAELAAAGIAQLSKREASRTPPAFRDLLLSLARGSALREGQEGKEPKSESVPPPPPAGGK